MSSPLPPPLPSDDSGLPPPASPPLPPSDPIEAPAPLAAVPLPAPDSGPALPPVSESAVSNEPRPEPPPLPPFLPETLQPPPPPKARLSRPLLVALIVAGIAQLVLVSLAAPPAVDALGTGRIIGLVIGASALWPLILIGLFSLAPRFRTPDARAIIALSFWSLVIMGNLGTLVTRRVAREQRVAPIVAPTSRSTTTTSRVPRPTAPRPKPAARTVAKSTPAPALDTAPLDFSPGSDARLIKLIEHAQEERYHTIVEAYAKECAAQPHNPTVALERLKFIERFAYAEDTSIESADEDRRAALDYLEQQFPNTPETILHQLESTFGAAFETKANESEPIVLQWAAAPRARFYLLRAQAASRANPPSPQVRRFATQSFIADPSIEAALILARDAHTEHNDAECVRLLRHTVFDKATVWQQKQQMELLFDAKENDRAISLYRLIKYRSPALLNQAETALRLAHAGQVGMAREIFAQLKPTNWNREQLARSRFAFEMEFGDAEHARDAYRDLRQTGLKADPLWRERAALLWKYPRLGWSQTDIVGAILFGLVLASLAASPLLVLVPVHYWSLLRARRGKTSAAPDARWGLRVAWVAIGSLLVTEFVALWTLAPEVIRSWWSKVPVATIDDRQHLWQQALAWTAMAAVTTVLLWRAKRWRLMGPGTWSFARALGYGLAATILLRIALLLYLLIWPQAAQGEIAAITSNTQLLCLSLLKQFGPLGLIAAVAILVPVLEEFLFRGVCLEALAKHLPFGWANFGQALAFAAVHANLRMLPFYVAFGLAGGWLARRSGGLLPSTIMHAGNNLLVCIALIAQHRGTA